MWTMKNFNFCITNLAPFSKQTCQVNLNLNLPKELKIFFKAFYRTSCELVLVWLNMDRWQPAPPLLLRTISDIPGPPCWEPSLVYLVPHLLRTISGLPGPPPLLRTISCIPLLSLFPSQLHYTVYIWNSIYLKQYISKTVNSFCIFYFFQVYFCKSWTTLEDSETLDIFKTKTKKGIFLKYQEVFLVTVQLMYLRSLRSEFSPSVHRSVFHIVSLRHSIL